MKKTMIASLAALFALAVYAKTSTPEGWLDDYDAALKKAADENKHIVVDFSGSDWCGWCKRLDKEVFATDEFKKAASEKYVLLMVDSPMKKSLLTPKAAKENPKLVEKFGVNGFPTVVVLDPKGEEVCRLGYEKGGPAKYIEKLDAEIRDAPDVKKYIKPIEDVLNSHDSKMEEESRAVMEKVEKKFPKPKEGASKSELRKYRREAMKYAQQVMFEEVYAKYVPLYDKAFAEAKAMKVPANMESRKKDLIDEQESRFEMLKTALKAYEEAKKNGTLDKEDEEGDDDDDDDDERMSSRVEPRVVLPLPADAKTDKKLIDEVTFPFYRKHIVETYDAASETNDSVRTRMLRVRESLAIAMATMRDEFPTSKAVGDANWLWGQNCRDAAVAIVRYMGLDSEPKFFQGQKLFKEAIEAHDDATEPFLGFLLRRWAYRQARHMKALDKKRTQPVKDALGPYVEAFEKVVPILKAADRRIAERLDSEYLLPENAGKQLDNEYLALCAWAERCMSAAFESRGQGWASEVTEDGWKGWQLNNNQAESNLLAAVAMRPEEARPALMLSSLYGRSCGNGDAFEWFNRGVSNSIDVAAQYVDDFVHYQTSRWGGSTRMLLDLATNAAATVRTDSCFAYVAASAALNKIFRFETDGSSTTNQVARILTPEVCAAMYRMFDTYVAAGPQPNMPSPDIFRCMGLDLAVSTRDWARVRAYAAALEKPVSSWKDHHWIRRVAPREDKYYMGDLAHSIAKGPDAKGVIAAEEAIDAGRHEEAYRYYEGMSKREHLDINERQLAGRQLFRERLFSQETAGGWMDLMPTGLPGEAEVWWGHMHLDEDGRARFRHNFRSYYFLLTPLHGLNSEFEATVYFEEKDPNQKEWDIGWGLARPTYGRTISSGAVPYIHFFRDKNGDHVAVESYTEENAGAKYKAATKHEDGRDISRQILVRDLAKQPSHSFNLKTGPENVVITVDGNEILSSPCKEFFASYEFGECIMSNGDVLPVWKLFKNTAFSGYHYRRVPAKEESGAEGRNPQAPAEALKAAIAPLATSMSEIVKNKAYSGGWGYDEKTAVVISAEDEISGVELERPFLLLRSQSEVIAALEKTKLGTKDDIDAVVPTVKSQGLISSGGRSYDSIEYEVCVKLTNGVVFTYDAECWFDITSFFGK